MRSPHEQGDQGEQAQRPDHGDGEDHQRQVDFALHEGRQQGFGRRRECRQQCHQRNHDGEAQQDRRRHTGIGPAGTVVFQQGVTHDRKGEAGVPEHVEPHGALNAGAEHAAFKEQPRIGEGMADGHQRDEQKAARQHEQAARPRDRELAVQQCRGDQVVDGQGRLIVGDETHQLRQLHLCERHRSHERHQRQHHRGCRQPALGRPRWLHRQDECPFGGRLVRHASLPDIPRG